MHETNARRTRDNPDIAISMSWLAVPARAQDHESPSTMVGMADKRFEILVDRPRVEADAEHGFLDGRVASTDAGTIQRASDPSTSDRGRRDHRFLDGTP